MNTICTYTFDKGSPRNEVQCSDQSAGCGFKLYWAPNLDQNGWYGLPVSASEQASEINLVIPVSEEPKNVAP